MKNTLILAACNIQISAKTHISEFATKPFETKMEVDSDSEQPSGSGTVSKDKKRWVPDLHYYQAHKRKQMWLQIFCLVQI